MKPFSCCVLRAATAFLLAFGCGALALDAPPEKETYLKRAVFAEGRVWMVSNTGALFSLAEGDRKRRYEDIKEPVFDICLRDSRPVIVTGDALVGGPWRLRARFGDAWALEATVAGDGEKLRGVACGAGGVTLLTSRRIGMTRLS